MLVREAIVDNHPSTELLGPGDVLRAWDDADYEQLLPRTIEWTALTATRVAIIDRAFAVRAAQWPEIFAGLLDRAARRAERLVVMQAIAHSRASTTGCSRCSGVSPSAGGAWYRRACSYRCGSRTARWPG